MRCIPPQISSQPSCWAGSDNTTFCEYNPNGISTRIFSGVGIIRISVLTKLLIIVFVVLAGINICFSLLASNAGSRLKAAFEQRYSLILAVQDLQSASADLTRWARAYAVTGNRNEYDDYWNEIKNVRRRERAVQTFSEFNAPRSERNMIEHALNLSNTLATFEEQAFNAKNAGDSDLAVSIMFGHYYEIGRLPIVHTLNRLSETVEYRTQLYLDDAYRASARYELAASISVVLFALISIVGVFVILKKVAPLAQLALSAIQVARGNINVDFAIEQNDEIRDVSHAFSEIVDTLRSLQKNFINTKITIEQGGLDFRINEAAFQGAFNEIVAEVNNIIARLEYREDLLDAVNNAAQILLTATESNSMNSLVKGVEIIGLLLGVDRASIWQHEERDGDIYFIKRHEWLSESGQHRKKYADGFALPYSASPEFFGSLLDGFNVNGPITNLSPSIQAHFIEYEVVSVVVLPMFLNNKIAGFFSLQDCEKVRAFNKDEMDIIASAGLMFTSVLNNIEQSTLKKEHETEIKLRESMELARKLLDISPILIELWEEDGSKCIGCNKYLLDAFGLTDADEFGDNWTKFSAPIQPCGTPVVELNTKLITLAAKEGYSQSDWLFILPNGEEMPADAKWLRLNHYGKSIIIAYSIDLRPLRAAMELEESNKAKSRFLARMSHEIRTPITAVMGISEIQLRNQTMPPHTEEAFSKIYDSSKTLLNIVNDILDFSKIESGKMLLLENEYSIASVANDVSHLHLVYLDNKDITFEMYVDKNIPVTLVGDSLRIKQIINNLLTNAFKYTESGSIILSLERKEHEKEGYMVLSLSVKDTGIGMSKQQIEELQGSDYLRFHENEMPFVAGTGLGLPIVYSMVQIMDADFDMQSEVGKGTHVTIDIPQKIAATEILGDELAKKLQNFESGALSSAKDFDFVPTQLPNGSVLVVDDVDTNLYVAEAMLDSFGLSVELVESGHAAIDKITQGNIYDIIFMDHMMPEMDGIETTQRLRSMGYTRPIVALTANAVKGQAEVFMKNGFSGFMSKPIDIKILNSYLVRFISC
ncbi:MAG: response regulator [Defluviitaleaceae bacterium]|nr:response regulator [Defluviitaleaceae bacterium]